MPKITALQSETAPTSDDFLAIVDNASGTTKKVTKADLLKGQALTNLNGGTTDGVLATDASGNVTVSTMATDANGWTTIKHGAVRIYQKNIAGVSASAGTTGVSGQNLPVGETWASVGPYMHIQARTAPSASGAANDIRTVPRTGSTADTWDLLVTAGASTTAYITATIIKVA